MQTNKTLVYLCRLIYTCLIQTSFLIGKMLSNLNDPILFLLPSVLTKDDK